MAVEMSHSDSSSASPDRQIASSAPPDLFLVVSGLDVPRHGEALERLLDGLDGHFSAARERFPRHRLSTRQGEGVGQATIDYERNDGTAQRLEIRELAWTDLRPSLKDVSVYIRLWRGAYLSAYWLGPLLFRSFPKGSRSLRWWLLVGFSSAVFWYLLVAVAAVSLLRSDIHSLVPTSEHVAMAAQAHQGWASSLIASLTRPEFLWTAVVAMLGFKPLVDNIDLSWSAYSFIVDRDLLRRKLRLRLRGMLSHVEMEADRYRRIVVVAHSFGCAVAADALGAFEQDGTPIPPLELITLGGPLEFFCRRNRSMQDIVENCVTADDVTSWSDFYAPEDAFCSRVPLREGANGKFRSRRVTLGYSAFQSARAS